MTSYAHALQDELKETKQRIKDYARWGRDEPEYLQRLQQNVADVERAIEEMRNEPVRRKLEKVKTAQEEKEAQIAALNSTTLGQKLPEDVIRKVSEYGGRKKRKTRKARKTRKTRRV